MYKYDIGMANYSLFATGPMMLAYDHLGHTDLLQNLRNGSCPDSWPPHHGYPSVTYSLVQYATPIILHYRYEIAPMGWNVIPRYLENNKAVIRHAISPF